MGKHTCCHCGNPVKGNEFYCKNCEPVYSGK